MKRLVMILLAVMPLVAAAQTPHSWLHVHHLDGIKDFHSFKIDEISEISHTCSEEGCEEITVTSGEESVTININDVDHLEIGTNVPTLRITLPDNPEMTELVDKNTYLNAIIEVDGNGIYDDLEPTTLLIKGRGNSTWNKPKKPYRLKFDSKIPLLGLQKSKSFILIANYIDCTLMRNAVALHVAQWLGMPFTNHTVPVRVYLNGDFKGAYFLSEKIGISKASVNIDEQQGVLLELDTNYDEPYKFRSDPLGIPVMVKDPDFDELALVDGIAPEERLAFWQADFNDMVATVCDGGDFTEKVDLDALVKYLLVYNISGNHEVAWPKSVFLYKASPDDLWHFGPVWDFDWAFTYDGGYESPMAAGVLMGRDAYHTGEKLFAKMIKTEAFQARYQEVWDEFLADGLPELMTFIDEYAATIRESAIENGVRWPAVTGTTAGSFNFDMNVKKLKKWILSRAEYISESNNFDLVY